MTDWSGVWDGGGINDDGGGDGKVDAMARHQNRVAYKEENTLYPGDGGSTTPLFPALDGIGNGDRNSLTSKLKKRIPPKNKKKFGRTKTGKNKKSPVSQSEYHKCIKCNTTETSKANT